MLVTNLLHGTYSKQPIKSRADCWRLQDARTRNLQRCLRQPATAHSVVTIAEIPPKLIFSAYHEKERHKEPNFYRSAVERRSPIHKARNQIKICIFFSDREIASSALSVRRSVRACYSLHLLYVEKKSCYGHSNKAVSALTWFSSKLIFWASPSNKAKWLWKPRTHIFIRMYTIDKERDCKRLLHHLIKQGLTNCIPTNSI